VTALRYAASIMLIEALNNTPMVQKKPPRKKTLPDVETAVLAKSARRCTLCFHLKGDLSEKLGQIARLDEDRTNSEEDNLAWMCLEHHSLYDSKTKQHKNYTIHEVKASRAGLYDLVAKGKHLIQVAVPSQVYTEADKNNETQRLYPSIVALFERAIRHVFHREDDLGLSRDFSDANAKVHLLAPSEIAAQYFNVVSLLEDWSRLYDKPTPRQMKVGDQTVTMLQSPDPTERYKGPAKAAHEKLQEELRRLIDLMRVEIETGGLPQHAKLQLQQQERQLKKNLFDQRFAVFVNVRDFITYVLRENGKIQLAGPGQYREFWESMEKAEMLFGTDVNKYLGEVDETAREFYMSAQGMDKAIATGDIEAINKNGQLLERLRAS